jgi:hypothetical protein
MNKVFLVLAFFFLALPFVLAEQFEPTSLGEFSLPNGEIIQVVDAVVFVAIFVIFFAIVLELIALLGFMEKVWMRILSSFIIVLLININGLIFRMVLFLKDFSNFTNFISSLTLVNWLVIVLVFALSIGVLILLRKLIAQWKEDAKKEEKEMEEIEENTERELRRKRRKFGIN